MRRFISRVSESVRIGILGLVLLGMSVVSANAQPAVLGGPVTFDGNDYYILEQSDWYDANAAAEAMGGYLTTIQSEAENDFLETTFGNWGGSERAFWIGLNDDEFEGYFRWENGHPLAYTNWLSGQPAGGTGQNHIYLRPSSYQWDDINGDAVNVCCAVTSPLHGVVEVGPRQGGLVDDPKLLIQMIGVGHAEEEDFEDFPLNPSGFGAFSNGATFGSMSLTSLAFGADIELRDAGLNLTGLFGTFLVDDIGGDSQVRPGGQNGAGTPEDDDDFRIDFSPPVSAAGVFIGDNRLEAGESIEFRRADESVLASRALPGGNSGSGSSGYVGYVTAGSDERIASIVVNEAGGGGTLNDDIVFDRIIWGDIDSDFDGIDDNDDNCPEFFNPSQDDDDGDGVGDFCDNCKSSYNPNQENTGGAPERGDACGTVTLELVRDSMAINPTFGLRLDCSLVGVPVSEVNVGLRIPFGAVPATADFGGGCDAPINPIAPGVPTGLGCTANVYLGSNVSAADSGAYGPGLASPFASDAKYIHVRGNGADDRLCDPYSGSYLLGRFTTGPSPLFSPTSVIVSPGLSNVGLKKAADIDGEPIEFGFAVIAGAADPDLKIILKPAAGEDEATATRWSLCISDITDQRMHRISAGLRVVDATDADIRVLGCDSTPDMSGVRDCDADMPDISVGPTVDDVNSFTMGPFESPTAPTVPDTMYVVVEGSAAAPGATTLNPTQFQEWCVATIEVDAPPGTAGVPPEFVTNGLALLPYSDMTTDAWQTSSTLLDPLTLEQVALDNGFNQGDDLDGDGELDTADNCDFAENPGQENNGDFLLIPSPPDDDGDACECGDANGSGAVFDSGTPDLDPEDPMAPPLTPDLQRIREHLVGLNPGSAATVEAICSVFASGAELADTCNTKDAVVLQRALNTQAPGISTACDAALPD